MNFSFLSGNKQKASRIFWMLTLILSYETSNGKRSEDKTTDVLNSKLRTFNEKGEMDDYKASIAEVLVSKNEAIALSQLNKLLAKYKNSPLEPNLLFRKAELYIRQSKSARFFEFNRSDKILTLLPVTVKANSSQSKLKDAVAIFDQITNRFPNYADLDLVLFNSAFIRQQLDQENVAEKIYRSIIQKFPESYLIPDAHMSLAEMLYKNNRFESALIEYEAIKEYPLARVYTYALYKTGWTKYQLKDVVGAVKELEVVIKVSEQNLVSENGNKISLKSEALTDLVLFYPEAFDARKAFAYFKGLAGSDAGKYIVSLAQLYESHSKYSDFEVILNDLISNMPKSAHAPVAFKSLIDVDLILKSYDKAAVHMAQFEKHCHAHFAYEFLSKNTNKDTNKTLDKSQVSNIKDSLVEDDSESMTCPSLLSQQSLKVAAKWHKEWQNKKKKIEEATAKMNDKNSQYLNSIAAATELSYQVYLRNSCKNNEQENVRFNYAELLFALKKFKESSEQYYLVSLSIRDEKLIHESSYFAILGLESAVGEKWSDSDEDQYLLLSKNYIKKNPSGKFVNDVTFKRSFIAYEKARYEEALEGFKALGWNKAIDAKIAVKAQDLYLDILNLQKKYEEIMNASFLLAKITSDLIRKQKIEKIYRSSFFAYALDLQNKKEYDKSASLYEKFYKENASSELADKSLWNLSQIYLNQNKLNLAADKYYEFYKLYPKSENSKNALEKSAELYEFLGQTEKVARVASELTKIDAKNYEKWIQITADFELLSGNTVSSLARYKEILKVADSKKREVIVEKLKRLPSPSSETLLLIAKYDRFSHGFEVLQKAKKQFEAGNFAAAFKSSSEVVGEKEALALYQAEARFIQAEILAQEFFSQSIKTKVDRLELVLNLKTEKLDKAQRAYQSTIRYGISEVSSKSFLRLSKIYSHYVDALKNIQLTDSVSLKDKEILQIEIDKISMPIEEKIAETLMQGLEFVKKYPDYSEIAFELQNELSKVNFKGIKFVAYKTPTPKLILPETN